MKNRIFLKISLVIISIIIAYASLAIFLISPKISDYFASLEIKQAKSQLKRVEALIKSKEEYLKEYRISKEIAYVDTKIIDKELSLIKQKILIDLNSLIKDITKEDLGYVFIVDSDGLMVVHPDEKIIYKDKSAIEKLSSQDQMFIKLKEAYENKKAFEYKWNKQDDPENYIYDKLTWVTYNDYFKFYICSSIYKDDLYIKAKQINTLIINTSLFLTLILLLLGVFFVKKLLFPISLLSINADLVKQGNLKVRNNIHVNDELGYLANHFDSMLDSIEENTKSLEYKIEARTAEIKHKLYYDELTGLKNRESLIQDLKTDDFLALTLVDIQGFDDINELYGFEVGNEILVKTKKLLKSFASKNDVSLYRIDSDIFAFRDLDIHRFLSYEKFLKQIQEIFRKEIHIDSLGIDIFVYTTLGTSISQSDSLKSASIALKKAKSIGAAYLVYNKEIDTKDNIKKTMYWREKIKDALEKDRVVPFFQPIFNRDNEVIKYESLMRIYDEIDNKPYYLSPGTFFEVAIKTRQYFKLNQTIIKKVFDNIDKIARDISINLAFSDVLNLEFNDFMEIEINKLTQAQREKVIFEILESDKISDYEILDNFIFKYREKGIRIAIDDFGTGFSNFSHILKVKPDYIKIDGSLIQNINKDENSYQMVKSIVEFSKSLKITVIAEYIHSKEVYDIVKDLNIDEFQGYYLGEPQSLI